MKTIVFIITAILLLTSCNKIKKIWDNTAKEKYLSKIKNEDNIQVTNAQVQKQLDPRWARVILGFDNDWFYRQTIAVGEPCEKDVLKHCANIQKKANVHKCLYINRNSIGESCLKQLQAVFLLDKCLPFNIKFWEIDSKYTKSALEATCDLFKIKIKNNKRHDTGGRNPKKDKKLRAKKIKINEELLRGEL